MATHVLLAFTDPVEGQEDAYDAWYNETHIPEILSVPGIVSARRFRTKIVNVGGALTWKYMAIYEVETDNLSETLKTLGEATGEVISALDQSKSAPLSPRRSSRPTKQADLSPDNSSTALSAPAIMALGRGRRCSRLMGET